MELLPEYIRNLYVTYSEVGRCGSIHCTYNGFDFSKELEKIKFTVGFANSSGISFREGNFDESDGTYIAGGNEGVVLREPYTKVKPFMHNITLNYAVLESPSNEIGTFDVS